MLSLLFIFIIYKGILSVFVIIDNGITMNEPNALVDDTNNFASVVALLCHRLRIKKYLLQHLSFSTYLHCIILICLSIIHYVIRIASFFRSTYCRLVLILTLSLMLQMQHDCCGLFIRNITFDTNTIIDYCIRYD